jgi:tRNA modification GTPase
VVIDLLLRRVLELGARAAEPGEFTQRAFLNDKLDLAQAEAVADLIDSGSAQAARAALRSLQGGFSSQVQDLAEAVLELRMWVEAAIDFPEEDVDFLGDRALDARLEFIRHRFAELAETARQGALLRDGLMLVIAGRPNAGKSSLLNLLSGQDAAIVTEVAGTTRDVLREQIDIDGLAVELVDTAGLREDPDRIEAEGIRRARNALANADAVLWIQDATDPEPGSPDEAVPDGVPITIVRNKIDLSGESPGLVDGTVNLSAKTGAGVDALRARIRELAGYEDQGEGAFTARRRHLDALRRAADHFASGRRALDESAAGELLAEELRLSQEALGEITGAVSSDDLLGRIFSEFCIGK